MTESLLSERTGVPVREHCDSDDNPRCCFEAALSGATGRNSLDH